MQAVPGESTGPRRGVARHGPQRRGLGGLQRVEVQRQAVGERAQGLDVHPVRQPLHHVVGQHVLARQGLERVALQHGHEIDHGVAAIDRLFPQKIGYGGAGEKRRWVEEIPVGFDQEASPILATSSGYLQAIDDDKLMKIAKSKDLLVRIKHRPGKFVVQGSELLRVWPGERVNEKLTEQLNEAFILGKQRTEQQDVEFCINQLVEVAIRAISPAVNDPFTAIRCIDQLSAGLCRLAQRDFPSSYRYDDDNNLRVIADPVTFAKLTDDAFNQIRQYSKPDVAVTIRMLEALAVIATHTCNKKDRAALLHHANAIEYSSREEVSQECDYKDIEERYLAAVKALSA